ncbi:MAG: SUMF1/EgtB/PvdO family nonheme iron enzyme [Nostocaceae cyanobacterium]|nr:SUMF1/EgtB/PvdO family nonheme iron enzyme [Nostocaceae cyanobacterium]
MIQSVCKEKKQIWDNFFSAIEHVFHDINYIYELLPAQQYFQEWEQELPIKEFVISKNQLESQIHSLRLLLNTIDGVDLLNENIDKRIQDKLLKYQQYLLGGKEILSTDLSNYHKLDNLGVIKWVLAETKEVQLELKNLYFELGNKIRISARTREMEFIKEQQKSNNSPIWLIAEDILRSNPNQQPIPLRVFFSPPLLPTVNFAESTYSLGSFPEMEKSLARDLRKLFEIYSAKGRPVEFFAGAWTNRRFHSEIASKAIFKGLKSEPSVILESVIEGDTFDVSFASWGINGVNYRYQTLTSFSWREVIYDFAKQRTLQWFEKQNKSGKSDSEIENQYGQKIVQKYRDNLKIIAREQQCLEAGEDLTEIERDYNLHHQDYAELRQFISIIHCLFAGLIADEYFLLNLQPKLRLPPLLPEILPELMPEITEYENRHFIKILVAAYEKMYQTLAQQEASWTPELLLDLAESLMHLPQQVWAENQIDASVLSWLQLHGINQTLETEPIAALQLAVSIEDQPYVDKLNQCLARLGDGRQVSIVDACYSRGVTQSNDGNYQGAVYNLNQVITINPNLVEAYYYRGIGYAGLEKYEEAIADYNQVLYLQPMHALAYNQLGDTYYRLNRYEKAIENYNKAVVWGLESAAKNRDFVEGLLAAQQEKQKQEQRQTQELEARRGQPFEFDVIIINERGELINSERGKARYQTVDLGNGVLLEMVYIPGGVFQMGSPEKQGDDDERPQHTVTVKSFYMGKYPITQQQWQAVAALPQINCPLDPDPSEFKGLQRPVESISWYQSVEFCARLSQKTGNTYRLPSEAEWEYACRAGTTTPFHFGKTITAEIVNFDASYSYALAPKGDYRQQTTPVGIFSPNAFGLYDMHGNVWEWCADIWHPNYEGAPKNGGVWELGGNPTYRLLRGGSWNDLPTYCRSAHRLRTQPNTRFKVYGLRVVGIFPGLTIPG